MLWDNRSAREGSALLTLGREALEVITETLWPTRCGACDKPGNLLCETCESILPFIDACTACPRCGAAYGRIQCCECNAVMLASSGREVLPFNRMASAVELRDDTHRIISVYKDSGEQRLAEIIAAIMARYIAPEWICGATVTCIPATTAAMHRRGFDHAELLATSLASRIGLDFQKLIARPHTRDQRQLSRRMRLANMNRIMSLADDAHVPPKVIVVDDVCTTGATLYAAADALRDGGACELFGLTFARA